MLCAPVARVKNPLRTRLLKAAMTQDDCTDLRQRVIRLEDIERARGFMFTYAETVDAADPETVAGLFRQDGLLSTSRGVARGRAEIRAFFEKAFAADHSRKRHFVVNLRATWLEDGLVRRPAAGVLRARLGALRRHGGRRGGAALLRGQDHRARSAHRPRPRLGH
jgi:uncharacterized protein (TIGR02246 family)